MNTNTELYNSIFVLISEGKIDQLKRVMEQRGITVDYLNRHNIAIFFNAAYTGVKTINELLDMGFTPDFDFYYNWFLNNLNNAQLIHLTLILFLMTVPGINVPRVNEQMKEYLNNPELDLVPILNEISSVVPFNSERARPLIAYLGSALGPDKLSELIKKTTFDRRKNIVHHYNRFVDPKTRKNMRNRWMMMARLQQNRGGGRQKALSKRRSRRHRK